MNIPKDKVAKDGTVKVKGLRDCFKASLGMSLVEADFSALEARIVALVSGDDTLLTWFAQNVDIHRKTAALMFGLPENEVGSDLREQAKTTRYAFQYGATSETAWRNAVVDFPKLTLSGMVQLFKVLRQLHPNITTYHKAKLKQAHEDDYVEDPFSGMRFHFHGAVDQNQVFNLPIQTFGAELINRALLRLDQRLGSSGHVLLQVHDSLVGEAEDALALATAFKEEMEQPVEIAGKQMVFPVDVKVSERDGHWGDMRKVKL
jgi:DNA polymerase-1